MIYAPFTIVWVMFWLSRRFSLRRLWGLGLGSFLGVGVAGFFILPAFLEKGITQEDMFTSGYSYFAAHFVSLNQLFISRFWGYGGSIFGTNDGLSVSSGLATLVDSNCCGAFRVVSTLKNKKEDMAYGGNASCHGAFLYFYDASKESHNMGKYSHTCFCPISMEIFGACYVFLVFCLWFTFAI